MSSKRPGSERRRALKFMREAFWRQKGLCLDCGVTMSVGEHPPIGTTATVEHLKPRSQGGGTNRKNIAATCLNCNQARARHLALSAEGGKRGAVEK